MRRLKRCRGVFTGVCGVRFSHFSQSAFNELTYHFSAQLRKLYYFKSIMNPVAIYHFFKKDFLFFICFVVYDQMAISREGGRRKVAKKTLASRFQCCKECSQFAPYLAFSILAFFKGIRISIPQLWITKISRRPKCAFWFDGGVLFWNLVVDFQQSKQKVKTSFLAL